MRHDGQFPKRNTKVSGFVFIRKGVKPGYPFAPSIRSLLPLYDEMIIKVPRSRDDMFGRINAVDNPKVDALGGFCHAVILNEFVLLLASNSDSLRVKGNRNASHDSNPGV